MAVVPLFLTALFWNFCVFLPPYFGLGYYSFYLIFVIFALTTCWGLRQCRIEWTWDFQDGLWATGVFAILIIFLWPALHLSLAGDELYHAMASNPVLMRLEGNDLFHFQGFSGWEIYLKNIARRAYSLLDKRHIPVKELWRLRSLPWLAVLAILVVWARFFHDFSSRNRIASVVGALALSVYFGLHYGAVAELHPPLRNLPAFIMQLFFGLEAWVFKIPPVVAAAGFILYCFKRLPAARESVATRFWVCLAASSTFFYPPVYYALTTYEPSVWAFFGATLLLIESHRLLSSEDISEQSPLITGLFWGIGCLMRHTLVFYAPIFYLSLLYRRKRLGNKNVFFSGLPVVLSLPFLLSAILGNYTAALNEQSTLGSLWDGLRSGALVMPLFYNSGVFWSLGFAALVSFAFYQCLFHKRLSSALVLGFPFVALLFHAKLVPSLWGVGRYQAEFLAPFLALLVFQLIEATLNSTALWQVHLRRIIAVTLFLVIVGIQNTISLYQSLASEVNYYTWGQMRLTTSAYFPYRQALEFLRSSEANGDFIFLGGQPWYGSMPLWLAGHSLADSNVWTQHQSRFQKTKDWTPESFETFLRDEKVAYIVVQSGTKRERQHQGDRLKQLIQAVRSNLGFRILSFQLEHDYGPEMGGYLSIYRVGVKP